MPLLQHTVAFVPHLAPSTQIAGWRSSLPAHVPIIACCPPLSRVTTPMAPAAAWHCSRLTTDAKLHCSLLWLVNGPPEPAPVSPRECMFTISMSCKILRSIDNIRYSVCLRAAGAPPGTPTNFKNVLLAWLLHATLDRSALCGCWAATEACSAFCAAEPAWRVALLCCPAAKWPQ